MSTHDDRIERLTRQWLRQPCLYFGRQGARRAMFWPTVLALTACAVITGAFIILIRSTVEPTSAPHIALALQAPGSSECGKACLTMLGYDGYGKDSIRINPDKMAAWDRAVEITPGIGVWPKEPRMLVVGFKGWRGTHWVVSYQDTIYCPINGKVPRGQYLSTYTAGVSREFVVLFKG